MKAATKALTGMLLAGLAVAAAFYFLRGQRSGEPASEAPAPPVVQPGVLHYSPDAPQLSSIKVRAVEQMPVPLAEPLNGRIAYNEDFTTRLSSPVAGRVLDIARQAGDPVKRGETLLSLDSPDLAAAVADLRKARSDEERKKSAFERSKMLLQAGVLARKDYESAEADYDEARAETQRADRRLRNLAPGGAESGQYMLRSPIAGVVAERKVNPGMEVRPDLPDPLFIVTDPHRLWALIDLPERNLSKVSRGQPVLVEVDAYPGDHFGARVEKIGLVVDPATRRVQVRCSIANPQGKLKPEMYARVTLLADERQRAVRIPNTAIVTEGLYSYAFVEKEPGTFDRRRLEFEVQDRDYSYLAAGIEPGERVVVAGAVLLNSQLALGQ